MADNHAMVCRKNLRTTLWLGSKCRKCQAKIGICIDLDQLLHWERTHLRGDGRPQREAR
jgi:hypothetical protein